jgi:hypothetical protein
MKNSRSFILIGACLAFHIAGCATVSTRTNRDPKYTGHPNRVFFIINLGGGGAALTSFATPAVSNHLGELLVAGVKNCGGDAEFSVVGSEEILDPLATEPTNAGLISQQARGIEMAKFKADVIVSILLNRALLPDGRTEGGNTIFTKVVDQKLRKIVWSGVSTLGEWRPLFGVAGPSESERAERLHHDLESKLQADGMLPACTQAPST